MRYEDSGKESLDCGAKLLAITFDDGPGDYTLDLLDALEERGVKKRQILTTATTGFCPVLLTFTPTGPTALTPTTVTQMGFACG